MNGDIFIPTNNPVRGFRVHHDPRPYDLAAAEARHVVGERFQKIILKGQEAAQNFIADVEDEYDIRKDMLVRGKSLQWIPTDDGVALGIPDKEGNRADGTFGIDEFALNQALGRAEVPVPAQYARRLIAAGRQELLAHSLNRLYAETDDRFLIRSVNGIRGFLSSAYKRIDSRPSLSAFLATAMQNLGAVPYAGLDLRVRKAFMFVVPQLVYIGDSVLLFGVRWGNSDYGAGMHQIDWFVVRAWCTNLAVGEVVLSQRHIGARLQEISEDLRLTEETLLAQHQALQLEMRDAMGDEFTPARFKVHIEALAKAAEQAVAGEQLDEILRRSTLNKGDASAVRDIFNRPDVEDLPAGNTRFRLSNAISLFARDIAEERPRDAYEMNAIAGKMLGIRKSTSEKLVEVTED